MLALGPCALAVVLFGCAPPEREEIATGSASLRQSRCQGWDRSGWLEFHDDSHCRKVEPSNKARTLSCPNVATDATGFSPSSGPMQFDEGVLRGIVDPDIKMTAILIRRVNGVPYYHYMSNGTGSDQVYPWSSSKFMGVAFAAQSLRNASGGAVGLTASTASALGPIPLGDLVTIVHSYDPAYDHAGGYPSNGLSRYFLNVAGRDHANAMLHGWLGRPQESLGANYGANPPSDLGYTFTDPSQATVTLGADGSGYETSLSTWTMAEMLKRLAVWDDVATRLPGLQPADLETLFYGAADSRIFPGELGGMSADLSLVVQGALDMRTVDARSQGRWRNFGKLGQGTAESGNPLVDVQYACLPVLDSAGTPVPNEGAEFVVSSFIAGGSASANDRRLAENYRRVVRDVILPRTGSGALDTPPPGTLDAVTCDAISGRTTPGRPVFVRLEGEAAAATTIATTADAEGAFRVVVPRSVYTEKPYTVSASADQPAGARLTRSGAPLTCRGSLEGALRPLTWEAFLAWKFDLDRDVAPVPSAALVDRPRGLPFAGVPVVVRPANSESLFVVESYNGDLKHHVPTMETLRAWHLGDAPVYVQADAAVASYPERRALRARPELVRTPDGSIFLVE